ncbi:C40 family peptidase [Nocardiopsis sp. CNT312]|uniref:C40 family peptidase n=1 Tax=Nocardiopsis sp. CNT312 TaxID=1137268 RepID=UPI00048C8604|nr:C40 family peptidase [Nocardiopsis sp. CNT312]
MLQSCDHEQTRACRPSDPGRQASPTRPTRPRRRTLAATAAATALLLTAVLAPAPALAAAVPDRLQPALPSSVAETVIGAAQSKIGVPYGWGGTGPRSFDCSGLVQWSFRQAGITLPRVAHDQAASGTRIPYSSARRGDILYWSNRSGYVYHVGIYLGGGRMIDAPKTGDHVRERDVTMNRLGGAVRL